MTSPNRTVRVVLRADVQGYTGPVNRAEDATTRLSRAADAVAKTTKIAAVAGGVAVGGLLASVVKTGLGYNALQQNSRAALSAILGGTAAANAQMDRLDDFARNSPFAKQVFIQAQQQLLGFGLQASKVIPTLDAIQQAVAAVGGSNDDILQISNALAQVVGTGQLGADTLNELGIRGIDAAKIIGQQMGQTSDEIRDGLTSGSIDGLDAFDALVKGMHDQFAPAADNVKTTWSGTVDRLKAGARDLSSALLEPFVGAKGGGAAIEWGNKVADVLRALATQAGPTLDHIVDRLTGSLGDGGIEQSLDNLLQRINDFDPHRLDDGLDAAVTLYRDVRDVLEQLIPLLATVGQSSAGVFVAGIEASRPFVIVLTKLLQLFNSIPAGVQQFAAGALIIALLASRFTFFTAAVSRTGVATAGLINEMRTLYVMANANGVALSRLGAVTQVANARFATLGSGAKMTGLLVAVGAVLGVVHELGDAANSAIGGVPKQGQKAADAVEAIAASGRLTNTELAGLGASLSGVDRALKDTFDPGFWGQVGNSVGGALGKITGGFLDFSGKTAGANAFQTLDAGLTQLIQNGNLASAQKAFKVVTDRAAEQGVTIDQVKAKLPGYTAALAEAKAANTGLADGTDEATSASGRLAKAVADAQAAVGKLAPLTDYDPQKYLDALAKVADAERDAARAAADVGRARADAARQAEQSERSLAAAQQQERQAQLDLTQARKDAARALADLNGQLEDAQLSQLSAQDAVARAKERLDEVNNSSLSSDLDKSEAEIAYRQALRALEQAEQANRDTQANADDLRRRGIEGSTEVIRAKQALVDATQAVADAERDAAQAAIDARQRVVDAYASLAEANQRVTDAHNEAWKASLQGTFAAALSTARTYVNGIEELIRRGLSADLIAQLIEAGPEKAAPIIRQLLADHSGRLIALSNQFQQQMGTLTGNVGTFAQTATLKVNTLSTALQNLIKNGQLAGTALGAITGTGPSAKVGDPSVPTMFDTPHAGGGWTLGTGGGRDDRNLTPTSPGEFVNDARSMSYPDNAFMAEFMNSGGRASRLVSGAAIAARTGVAAAGGVTRADLAEQTGALALEIRKLAERPVIANVNVTVSGRTTWSAGQSEQRRQDGR